MSDAFTDVAKMKKIKEEIKAHEGQVVEMTLETVVNAKRIAWEDLLKSIHHSLSLNSGMLKGTNRPNVYVESFTYSDILTEKNLIHYLD